jgi:choice-of-anchor B domain-containing protein
MRNFITSLIVLFATIATSQTFNVKPQGYAGGMPGTDYSDVWGYVGTDGKEYAIIGSGRAINIFDVSNCANPQLVFQYVDGANAIWRDFKTYQGYAYGICDNASGRPCREGLQIINLSNFTVTQDSATFVRAHNIWIDEPNGRLYVVGSNATSGQMTIYTLDTEVVNGVTYAGTPANPVLLKKFQTTYIHDIYVKNNIAYASHGYDGYRIWDVSNPNNIVQFDDLPSNTSGYNHSSWVTADGYSYACEEVPRGQPLRISQITGTGTSTAVNLISTFTDPVEAPTYTNCRPHNPFVKGDTLFISYYEDGAVMWDISNRTSPKRIAYYDTYEGQNGIGYNQAAHDWTGAWGIYPFLPSGCIVVGDITQGLFTFKMDVAQPEGNNLGVHSKMNGDLVFDSGKGIVLRNSEGYCYRLKVSNTGTLSTEQIICHVDASKYNKLYKSDLAFDAGFGVVLKNPNGNCRRLTVNSAGTLSTTSVTCSPTTANAKIQASDFVIETNTKGIVLSTGTSCYRVLINDTGALQTTLLSSCP